MREFGMDGIPSVVPAVAGKVGVGSMTELETFAGSFLSMLEAERRWAEASGMSEGRAGPAVVHRLSVQGPIESESITHVLTVGLSPLQGRSGRLRWPDSKRRLRA